MAVFKNGKVSIPHGIKHQFRRFYIRLTDVKVIYFYSFLFAASA